MQGAIGLLGVLLALTSGIAYAREPAYQPRRLEDGTPDLQGYWVASNRTPLIRPDGITELRISAAQVQEIEARFRARDQDLSIPNESVQFFDERHLEPVAGALRSSIIVDPADGRIPGTPRFQQLLAAFRAVALDGTDGPEQRPLWERCLGSLAAHPPILTIGFTNMHQIVQTRDAVLFFSESLHEARILRLHAAHPPAAVDSWLGSSIARWEGDTLVVETRNFKPDQNRRADFVVSTETVIVERFTRIASDELHYVFTVSDPTYYSQPWSGETHFLRSAAAIFEDACHEGNYSLRHILEAGRVLDARSH